MSKKQETHALRVIRLLRSECDIMRSRLQAILDCDEATDALSEEDVFGSEYVDLLLPADVRSLEAAIAEADRYMTDYP